MATAPEMTAEAPVAAPEVAPERAPIDAADFYRDQPAQEGEAPEQAQEGQQEGEQQPEPISRPPSWGNDQEEYWSKLPREVQEFVSGRERDREAMLTRRSQEAAQVKQSVEAQAREALLQIHQAHADKLTQMSQMIGLPQEPDSSLLNSQNPEDFQLYMRQKVRYDNTVAQVAQLQRSAEQARQQAHGLQSQAEQQAIQADEAKLLEKWPDWSEPSKRAERLARLAPIAAELGYTAEAQAQANSSDLFALDTVASWKEDAIKYRGLMKQKMEPVRAAKQAPPAMRAAAPSNGTRQPMDAAAIMYPNDPPRR